MRKTAKFITAASAAALLLGSLSLVNTATAADNTQADDPITRGKAVAEDRAKGNCFSCHAYEGANLPGNIGPMLGGWLKQKYKDKAALRAQIWDATKANPNSLMPPFGRHQLLSEKEIDDVTEWVWSMK
ncbi:MAG: sulfur oxidation c-type cytochrome SoxX [Gammaproteobacteria bacterium]|nr:sulfur oxidation c-type cytochrome SoxX [Gammaproteobacteria bacterium]